VDADVAQLVREQRLLEAAQTASARGDFPDASRIYEQACEWSKAAVEALHAGDGPRALRLAVFGGDDGAAALALTFVARDAASAAAATAQLTRAGRHAWAARVFEECDRPGEAARAWEKAGETRRAGDAFVRAGESAEAARVLQGALDQDPNRWDLAVAFGTLLGRLGRWEASARVLQRVPAEARERAEALPALVEAFDALDWSVAAAEARVEAEALGAKPSPAIAASRAPAGPESLFGRYTVLREVASSPRARVLACHDAVLGETVAVKVFAALEGATEGPAALARFSTDVLAVRRARHPAVVPIRECIPQGPATVQAWMAGGDLEGMLARFGALAPARAIEIACAVLSALAAAHEAGVIHRAVKPTNVLFDAVGGAHLGDFGSVHLGDVAATASTGLLRTLAYMSPEQRQGRVPTERSDVFSVGVMLHEMLTGAAPDPHLPLLPPPSRAHRGLDARHDRVVARLSAHDPAARTADTHEAIAALASLAWPAAGPRPAGPTTPGPIPWQDEAHRLRTAAGALPFDAWIAREIEPVPATAGVLARARAFAQAADPALQGVWRVDDASATVWLELVRGPALDRDLSAAEHDALAKALAALHAAGAVHGAIGRVHLARGAHGWVLRFGGEARPEASADDDRTALAALSERGQRSSTIG
jgi:serine/threonine-protein kinase